MNIFRIPNKIPFLVTNLLANFVVFLLLPGKVYADAKNYEVRNASKVWACILFVRKILVQTQITYKTPL